jgi:hypothetical protein
MHTEDLITVLAFTPQVKLNNWDSQMVYSFSDQIGRGNGFTEKQAGVAIRILRRHTATLTSIIKQDIEKFLENPTYKYPFRKLNNLKLISIVEHPIYSRAIKLEFPYNEELVKSIRKSRDEFAHAAWDPEKKAWIFALTEGAVHFLSELMRTDEFSCDEEFQNYADQQTVMCDHMDEFVPMLVLDQGKPVFRNISKNMPDLQSTEILAAVFEARRRGIFTWSEEITTYLESLGLDENIRKFLQTEADEDIHINCEKTPISCLTDIVTYMSPCLFVIPGGSEFAKLTQAYEFLQTQGIANENISVMFRLDSKIDEKFNIFVKENKLNSPITENTKVVFISSKLPKPVLKSNIKFNAVVNMGFGGVHYSIREYVGNHENLIYYTEKKKEKDLQFVLL